ncbi:MAG: hypothetical protein V4591_08960 [Bdellovibrionota bacterium]
MKPYFKFRSCSSFSPVFLLCAFWVILTANATPEKKQNIELPDSPSPYSHKAWYSIQLGNIPVGVLAVGVGNTNTGYPSDYSAQFVSRVGSSPFVSFIKGNLNKNRENKIELTQKLLSKNEGGIFQESENKWIEENNKLTLTSNKGATLQGLFPLRLPTHESSNQITDNMNVFYFQSNQDETKILVPFTGIVDSTSNLNLQYDNDNFLHSADLPIQEKITLNFKRISDQQYHDFLKYFPGTLIDFGWFSSIQSPKNEIDSLTETLNSCTTQASALNKRVIKDIPQSSYLSYRKLINISRFCSNTNKFLLKNKTKSYYEKLSILSEQIKKLLKEDRLELPVAITNSPDLTVFYNDTISFLWPKVTQLLIHNSIEEMNDNFELEKNRKSLLGIQINISSLQPKSVVRADIKLIEPAITFSIEQISTPAMSSNSIFSLPVTNGSSYFINGQFFIKNENSDLDSLCAKNQGKLGLDLGDAPQIIVNTGVIRGIWDTNTRVFVAREFAFKAASTKSCKQIIFRAPAKIVPALKNELEDFKNAVISPDNEILLSNFVQKKLLVMPGKYKMTTSSLVTGNVISTHEFNVEPGTNTVVNAKAN